MKGVIYYAVLPENMQKGRLHHMAGEALLAQAIKQEYGKDLAYEPRDKGEFGKPFFTLEPKIRYNISHSGKFVVCIFSEQEVGIDVQEHINNCRYEGILKRTVPEKRAREILSSEDVKQAFFDEWVLREAYIKWTGQGLSRNMQTIPMDEGWHQLLTPPDENYSMAVWAECPMELSYIQAEIHLP